MVEVLECMGFLHVGFNEGEFLKPEIAEDVGLCQLGPPAIGHHRLACIWRPERGGRDAMSSFSSWGQTA
jgi:hypothetical protein